MNKTSYIIFSQLCESMIQEASTVSNILPGDAAANMLIKVLHSHYSLAHDQKYTQTDNISWNTINDTQTGAFAIIKFAKGVGAIKASTNKQGYAAVAVTDENLQVSEQQFTKGGDVINYFKQLGLGKIQKLYVGVDQGKLGLKKGQRAEHNKQQQQTGMSSVPKLLARFRPLWLRAVQTAQADVKGMAVTMVQNNAYSKARKKLERLTELQDLADAIESGEIDQKPRYSSNVRQEILKTYVTSAVYLAASHFYPEETGNITRGYRGVNVDDYRGASKLLDDIGQGDQKKLSVVLGFFKRLLISG
jgi:hypothetical protein